MATVTICSDFGAKIIQVTQAQSEKGHGQSPSNVTCAVCVLQKHGLRLHLRNPYSFTPMLEEGTGGKVPRSLLLGTDMVENQKQIAQFSKKDAQVGKVTSDGSSPPSQPGGCSFFFLNIIF